jgi:hypothetical protein
MQTNVLGVRKMPRPSIVVVAGIAYMSCHSHGFPRLQYMQRDSLGGSQSSRGYIPAALLLLLLVTQLPTLLHLSRAKQLATPPALLAPKEPHRMLSNS